jgi:hypothetical protein
MFNLSSDMQRPEKIVRNFQLKIKKIAIGWRLKKVINSEIGRCLVCGVDAISDGQTP